MLRVKIRGHTSRRQLDDHTEHACMRLRANAQAHNGHMHPLPALDDRMTGLAYGRQKLERKHQTAHMVSFVSYVGS